MQSYLLQYGFPVAFALLIWGSFLIYRAQHKVPAILIGGSALFILTLRVLHEFSFSQKLVSYVNDDEGRVLGANIEFTLWQSVSLWVEPIGFITMACGFVALSFKLYSINKAMHPASG